MSSIAVDEADSSARLGAHIRALRKLRGLTLVQLADATELSHPFLSQLERGLAQPSLGSLRRIAVALETSPIELIAAAEVVSDLAPIEVHRHDEGGLPSGFASGTARMLAHSGRPFHPVEVVGDNAEAGPVFVHAEDEFLYVVEGTVDVVLDGQALSLCAGESAYYAGGVAHRWSSADGSPYRLLVVKQALGRGAALSADQQ